MTEMDRNDEVMLDDLFDAARRDRRAQPETALMSRVLADAEKLQPRPAAPEPARGQFWPGLLRALGGWPSMAGLATATLAGLWIGINAGSGLFTDGLGATVATLGQDALLSEFDTSYAYLAE